ncbi:PI-PLC X domain-containing protein 1 [Colletotrichum sp. SAR11_240]|nr:PI-PLC X domain-containing protein 1 [Colletotrichum sp. SAR11_240]
MRAALFLPVVAGLAAAACNGNDALCGKKYSEVTFVGSHNSPFVGIGPADNQLVSPTAQLDLGVRFLQAQTQNKDGGIQMCHTDCLILDAGSLSDYLTSITKWMNAHPDEVVTLLLTNIDAIPVQKFDDVFKNYHADTSKVNYILDEFQYFWETPYGETDSNFPRCNIDRPEGVDPNGRMYLVNHVLNIDIFGVKIPDLANAGKTNSFDSIDKQVNLCRGMWGKTPNVILGVRSGEADEITFAQGEL